MLLRMKGLVAIATSYFRQIFELSNPKDIEEVLSEVSTTITESINEDLTVSVSKWEVKLAPFVMHPEKAPWSDGMTSLFYQKLWDILKKDLTHIVNQFLFQGSMASGLNDTNIYLILKITKPNDMSKFHPISLCNVSYKLISKVLFQRLKKVLPYRVSETQSTYVVGRQILDNIMIAQEMFHALRAKTSGRNKRMAIKTGMSKAYDRMEWSFIEAVMRKMRFSETWIAWIMCCSTSVKYKVLMNCQSRRNIVSERGLRQGDLFSSFIFILCREALVSLLNHAKNQRKIKGCALHAHVPRYPTFSLLMIDLSFIRRSPVNVKK